MATIDQRITDEETRNRYLCELAWRIGDHPRIPADLAEHARRLAHACDPNEDARPK